MVSRQQKGWTKAHTHILASRDRVREMSAGSKQDKCNVALALTSWWAETRQESSQQAVDRTNEGQHSHSGKQRQCKREVSKQWRGQTRDSTHKLASRDEVRELPARKHYKQVVALTNWQGDKVSNKEDSQAAGLTNNHIKGNAATHSPIISSLFSSPPLNIVQALKQKWGVFRPFCMKTLTSLQHGLCSIPDFPFGLLRAWHWWHCHSKH